MSDLATCSATKTLLTPANTVVKLRCAQPPGHQGLHEADDPADASHRMFWDGAGECLDRRPTAPEEPQEPALGQTDIIAALEEEFAYLNRTIVHVREANRRLARHGEHVARAVAPDGVVRAKAHAAACRAVDCDPDRPAANQVKLAVDAAIAVLADELGEAPF